MDTRDQSPSKLTPLQDRSHPTHHRPGSLRIDYSRTTKSFMELERAEGWWWRWRRFPLSGAQDGLQICPLDEEQVVAAPPYRKRDENFSFLFFLGRKTTYRAGVGGGRCLWAPQACPPPPGGWWRSRGLWPTGPPPEVELGADIFDIFQNCSP